MPVFATVASQFGDPGVNRVFLALCAAAGRAGGRRRLGVGGADRPRRSRVEDRSDDPGRAHRLPGRDRRRRAAASGRGVEALAAQADLAQHSTSRSARSATRSFRRRSSRAGCDEPRSRCSTHCARATTTRSTPSAASRSRCCGPGRNGVSPSPPRPTATTSADGRSPARTTASTLSGLQVPKVAAPRLTGWGDLLRFLMKREPARRLSRTPPASSRTGARARIRPGCSRAKACPSARTAASTTSPPASRRCGSRRRSTRSPSTARTPPSAPTSGARSATPASRSRRSTTPRGSTRASTSARRRPRSR